MTDELTKESPTDILIIFDLEVGASAEKTRANLHATYVALSELGFRRVEQNIILPIRTVVGQWHGFRGVEEIRNILVVYLMEKGLPLERLMVVEFVSCAFLGTPVP